MGFRRRANASIKVFDPIKQCGSGFRKSDDHVSYNGRRIEFAVDDLVHSPREAADRFSEPISTAFLESAVNEILSKRMIKKQQMRRNRLTVRPFLDVRVAVLNKTLAGSFRRLYPDFQSDNESYSARLAA